MIGEEATGYKVVKRRSNGVYPVSISMLSLQQSTCLSMCAAVILPSKGILYLILFCCHLKDLPVLAARPTMVFGLCSNHGREHSEGSQ